MKKMVCLLMVLAFATHASAAQNDESCAQADCPLGELKCTVTDATGNQTRGDVVTRSFNSPGLPAGTYCRINSPLNDEEIQLTPICPGGELLLRESAVVGCKFERFGAEQRQACKAWKLMQRSKFTATCHVCIRQNLAGLVTDRGKWQQLAVLGGEAANEVAADFSCLQGQPVAADSQPYSDHPRGTFAERVLVPEGLDAPATDGWTPWLNRDNPGGSGDFEGLQDFVKAEKACPAPVDIQCRTRDGRDWRNVDQRYVCDAAIGGICRNQEQSGGRCLDYEVRFRCSSDPQLMLSCNDDQSTCECDSAHSCAILKLICVEVETTRHGLVGHDCRATNTNNSPH